MALTPVQVRLLFNQGIDTKNDPLVVPTGRLLTLENGTFARGGSILKRDGHAALSATFLRSDGTSGSMPVGHGLSIMDSQLVAIASGTAYAYGESKGVWADRGFYSRASVSHAPFVQSTTDLSCSDAGLLGGIVVHAWTDNGRGIRMSAVDATSSLRYMHDIQVEREGSGSLPRVTCWGGRIGITWVRRLLDTANSASLMVSWVDPAQPNVLGAPVTMSNDIRPLGHGKPLDSADGTFYDIVAASDGQRAVVAYLSGAWSPDLTPNAVKLAYANSTGTLDTYPAPVVLASHATDTGINKIGPSKCSVSTRASDGAVFVVTAFTDNRPAPVLNSLAVDGYTSALTQSFTNSTISGFTGSVVSTQYNFDILDIATQCRADGRYDLLLSERQSFDVGPAPDLYTNARWAIIDATGTVANAQMNPLGMGVALASKPFQQGGETYALTVRGSRTGPAYFLMREDGRLMASFLYGLAAPTLPPWFNTQADTITKGTLPNVVRLSDSKFLVPVQEHGEVESNAGKVFQRIGITDAILSFDAVQPATAQPTLLMPGGMLSSYDGNSFTEHTFLAAPEITAVAGAGTTGSMPSGSILWKAMYEWHDDRGQLHRSRPSLASGSLFGNKVVRLEVSNPPPTLRSGSRAWTNIGIYRTVVNDPNSSPTYYRCNPTGSLLANPATTSSLFFDILSDADLVKNEFLYTAGGVLPNDPPPASTLALGAKNRIFLAGLEDDPLVVAFSKERLPGVAPGFSDSFRLRLDPLGGSITALASMDDHVIVFKRGAVFFFGGDGPSDSDVGDFSPPVVIASDVGCNEPRSVVLTPNGVMFKSDKGIYLLDRSLKVSYAGAPVEAFNSFTITGAQSLTDRNQVRFFTREGTTLVYDQFFDQWSTSTGQQAVEAVAMPDGRVAFMSGSGVVYRSSGSLYADGSAPYTQTIETGWIRATEVLQAPWRVWSVDLVGTWKGPHLLEVSAAYDDNPTYVHSATFDPAASGVTSSGSLYQLRFYPQRQQCEAIRLRIRDLASGSQALGDSFVLNEALFRAGVDGTKYRLGDSAKSG